MEAKDYWGYWITVVQQLRVKVDALEKKVAELEARPAAVSAPRPVQAERGPSSMAELAGAGGQSGLSEKELSACIALKELGKPASVDEVNDHLRTSRKIEESMKETLFVRLKGAMEKGYVGFDSKSKKFILLKQDFLVG